MIVYAFEWCDCIHEEGFRVVSLHATKRGAFKAMVAQANSEFSERLDSHRRYGAGRKGYKPLQFCDWRVRSLAVKP